jgi:hypothetical protein
LSSVPARRHDLSLVVADPQRRAVHEQRPAAGG